MSGRAEAAPSATAPLPVSRTPERIGLLEVPGKPALFVGERRLQVSRKVSDLPTLAYSGAAILAKAKAKKQAFLAIQDQIAAYNAERGDRPDDLARHQLLLGGIKDSVENWVATYGKEAPGQAVHKKQRYTQFTLPQALNAEIIANEKLIASAPPSGASLGVAMPGMSPVRRRGPAPPPPQSREPLPVPLPPQPSGKKKPPPLPAVVPGVSVVSPDGVVESKEPAPPSPDEVELTDFQLGIVSAYEAMQASDADDDASLVARAFLQTMHDNLASFGKSIMAGGPLDELGRPQAGGRVQDLLKLKAALAAVQSNSNRQLYALLDIPKPDEKELGLDDVSAKVATANQAIADLGAITPAIAEKFASAATTTNRLATAKGLVGLGVGAGLSFAPVPGVSQAFSAAKAMNTVRSTLKHLRQLKKIQVMALSKGDTELVELLDYIIGKKESKAKKAGAGGIPMLGSASAAIYKMKGAWKLAKGTRGTGRKEAAAGLIDAAKNGNVEAQLVIMELVDDIGQYKEVLLGGDPGSQILANKMKSK